MRLLFVCNEYPPAPHGGIGVFVQTLARALVQAGHEAFVVGFYPGGGGTGLDQGVQVFRLPMRRWPPKGFGLANRILLALAVGRLVRAKGIDIVEVPDWQGLLPPFPLEALRVVRLHGSHLFYSHVLGERTKPSTAMYEKLTLRAGDAWAAVSQFVADLTQRLTGVKQVPISVLYNFVDTDVFSPTGGNCTGTPIILYVGSLLRKKGIVELVQALPKVLRQFPRVEFWAVGKDSPDTETGEVMSEKLLRSLPDDLRPRVHFLGARSHTEMPMYYQCAAVCVMPSHQEAFPLVWLEAMACGKAVLASKAASGPEAIEDGVSGLLCDPYDPSDIAAKLIYLLGNEDVREHMGLGARERVLERFSATVMVRKNIEFYASLLDGRK